MCSLLVAGSGGPASRSRCGAPHLFLWPFCLSTLLGPLRAGVAPLSLPALAVPCCLGAVLWLFFSAFRCLALRALAPRLGLPLGRWLLFGGFSPPPLTSRVSRFSSLLLGALVFFFFFFFFSFPCARPLSPAFSGSRPRVPWASALCVVCFVGLPLLGSPRACPSFVLSAWLLAAARGCVPCAVLCCASLGAVLRRAAARCALRCCAVLCCVALVGCRCLLRRALWRCPLPWGPVLCGAVFCGVPPRCVLCVVCVLSRRGGACCCSPLCFVLCVSRGAVLCVPCPLRSLRCCASLCWCARVVLFVWCVLLLAPGAVVCRGAVLGLVARGCLLVACSGVGVPVWPRGLLPCGWCGLLWCPAFLCRVLWCCAVTWCCAVVLCSRVAVLLGLALPSCGLSCCALLCCWLAVLFFARSWCLRAACPLRSVRCGALLCWLWCPASLCLVLWRCAVVWCCAVVLCCRFAVLFVFALPSCSPSCGASVVCAVVGASCCGVSLCVVVSPWAFCGVVVLLWCVVVSCCAVRCPAVPCCPAVLCWLAVLCGCLRCWCLFFLLSSFPLLKTPAVFPCL